MPDEYLTTALNDLADMFTPEVVLGEARRLLGPVTPSTPSRVADPDTSHASGERHRSTDVGRFSANNRKAQLLGQFARRHEGLTAYQAALIVMGEQCGVGRFEGCRRRVSDLAMAGYISDSGDRRPNDGGLDPAIVWKITPAGHLALDALRDSGWTRPKRALTAVAS